MARPKTAMQQGLHAGGSAFKRGVWVRANQSILLCPVRSRACKPRADRQKHRREDPNGKGTQPRRTPQGSRRSFPALKQFGRATCSLEGNGATAFPRRPHPCKCSFESTRGGGLRVWDCPLARDNHTRKRSKQKAKVRTQQQSHCGAWGRRAKVVEGICKSLIAVWRANAPRRQVAKALKH